MDFFKSAASRLMSHLMADGPVHEVAKRFDPESALFVVKCVTTLGAWALGEHAPAIKEILEAVHESEALEPVLSQAEVALGVQAAEQVEAEQVKTDEQVKAAQIKADAELAATVIEQETNILEKEVSEEPAKSAGERDALKTVFEREQQELKDKLDGMARNYFEKHPDLSEDQRADARATFNGIKEEALGNLREQQQTRLEELTRAQQEQREDLEKRRRELDGTRDWRS